jgi:hypothetical protein
VQKKKRYFSNRIVSPTGEATPHFQELDLDGLPEPGRKLIPGGPLYSYADETGKISMAKYKGKEVATVEEVRLIGSGAELPTRASMSFAPELDTHSRRYQAPSEQKPSHRGQV